MSNIAIIPIDNRPVCYNLAAQISSLDRENKVFLPDISFMGTNKKPADINSILCWLEELKNIDIVIIALDTIAYGGLVSSRKSNDDFFEIKARIERLKDILSKKNARIFAFSSIMRISNNNINDEEKEYWSEYGTKIYEYSYNIHKLEKTFKTTDLISKYTKGNIPPEILKDYTETRKRNFEINKYYIELKSQGIFNTLVFSKDDCAKFGLNVKEAEELEKLSEKIKDIYVKTGADEIPLSLISRALNSAKKTKIATIYTNPESINKISKYEDISVKNSVESQIELAGGILSNYEDCDLVLIVNNFKSEQGELVMNVFESGYEKDLKIPNKPYFIADILNANGADNLFVNTFFSKEFKKNFYGYSAWNTTGNSLGCAISTALTYYNATRQNAGLFSEIQLIRFLDDWAYQANIRSKIRDNEENLSNGIINTKMETYSNFLKKQFNLNNVSIEYSFPWNRFFEIEVSIK
ncbi:DUF4127 family protein [bacterium]|nr:DUF4127 family protein [bacterium]